VEVDVFLVGDKLFVGHSWYELRPERTLVSLYLDPLKKRIAENGGRVFRDGPPFTLLIDLKTEGKRTYPAVRRELEKYSDLLTTWKDGQLHAGPVTVIITGNRDRATMEAEKVRIAFFDGVLRDQNSKVGSDFIPWISSNWNESFKWDGTGQMPDNERAKMRKIVAAAHATNQKVRFFASPENEEVWREMLANDVDLINTDWLQELRDFLLKGSAGKNSASSRP
jgi:glycerophosphoryl diester phosphodiesterase